VFVKKKLQLPALPTFLPTMRLRCFLTARVNACYTPFTRSSWLDELLYVSWTSQLDICSMLARCLLDVCSIV